MKYFARARTKNTIQATGMKIFVRCSFTGGVVRESLERTRHGEGAPLCVFMTAGLLSREPSASRRTSASK